MSEQVTEADVITIHIDKATFRVSVSTMTGAQLRELASIPADRDLWLEVPGGEDIKVDVTTTYELKNGMHFFTAPATINPGA